MRFTCWIILTGLLSTMSGWAADIYVSPGSTAGAAGAKRGDTVWFKGGRYTHPLELKDVQGAKNNPVILRSVPGETVIFDGTDALDGDWGRVTPDSPEGKLIQPAQWERMAGTVYALKVKQPVYALVYKGRLMTDARWPNARWDDPWRLDRYMALRRASEESLKGDLHDGLPTENALDESEKWIHYDRSQLQHRDEMLGDTGISFTGATAVLSHTWGSWGTRITEHPAGSNRFKYDTTFAGSGNIQSEATGFLNNRIGWPMAKIRFKKSAHAGIHFFFMGLPALDIEEEWWYHEPTKTVYFIAPDGVAPKPGAVRGKRRDFQLIARDSRHLHIKGIEFEGGGALLENCEQSRLEDCNFRFAAMHKFGVGNFDMPVTTRIANPTGTGKLFGNALVNCQFTYQDGNAFEGRSTGLTIDNVLIHRTQQTTLGLDSRSMSIDRALLVRRVTINDVGASVGIKGGGLDSVYELNNIMRFGGLQYDGASLQMGGREKFVYRYNWSHDHPKRSYRFDAGMYASSANAFGEMSYNVAWNTPGGFAIKGDDHLIHNNVLIGDSGFELFNMKRWAGKNERTVVANNVVPLLSAGTYDWHLPVEIKTPDSPELITSNTYWLKETKVGPGHPTIVGRGAAIFDDGNPTQKSKAPLLAIHKNNYHDAPEDVLRDPANLDFRPKKTAGLVDAGHVLSKKKVPWKDVPFTGDGQHEGPGPDIGAYEYGTNHYWIPGFQFPHASTPVPPHNTTTAKADCDLMWLGGYKADAHRLYVGISEVGVTVATPSSALYQGRYKGKRNIHSFAKPLAPGATLYWRVDAERGVETIQGPVWKFTVGQ